VFTVHLEQLLVRQYKKIKVVAKKLLKYFFSNTINRNIAMN